MTGAPMMECKNALVAEDGNVEKAAQWLRKKGMAIAGKKSGREASQGLVAVKVSDSGDSAAIVEVGGPSLEFGAARSLKGVTPAPSSCSSTARPTLLHATPSFKT